jgi:hypothetical protein
MNLYSQRGLCTLINIRKDFGEITRTRSTEHNVEAESEKMAIDCDKDELENVEKLIADNLSSIQETTFQLLKFNFIKRADNKFLADQMYVNSEFIVPYKLVEISKYWGPFC